jgi:hypothetical protein
MLGEGFAILLVDWLAFKSAGLTLPDPARLSKSLDPHRQCQLTKKRQSAF